MARDSSGTFSLLGTLAPPGTVSDPTTINAIMTDCATALTDSINVNGTKPWAANQPMAGFKFTGIADGTARDDSASLGQAQKGHKNKATAVGGTVDAIALTFAPTFLSLSAGMEIKWTSAGANTIAGVTIAVDAIGGTITVKKGATAALAVGDTGVAGYLNWAIYDGTNWIHQNPATGSVAFTGGTLTTSTSMSGKDFREAKGAAVASAATCDIWTPADGNYVHITGTTGITSFGTAHQAGEERVVVFDGACIVTYNATSLILPGAVNYTTAAGDVMIVRADTTANMKVVDIIRASGLPVIAGGLVTIPKATADARSSTTMTDDTDFSFSMLASTNYHIRVGYFISTSASNACGIKIGIVGPASPTSVMAIERAVVLDGSSMVLTNLDNSSTSGSAVFTHVETINTGGVWCTLDIIWKNVNAGTFKLQTARQGAAGTATFNLNSYLEYGVTN